MSEYKNAIRRLRAGESDRQIARETKLGRHKVKELRLAAQAKGWLNDISKTFPSFRFWFKVFPPNRVILLPSNLLLKYFLQNPCEPC